MTKETMAMEVFSAYGLYILKDKRTIYLNGAVTSAVSALFNLALLDMESESESEDITIYINSPGGEVDAGLAMIDTMTTIRSDVKTVCVGEASSMAALILMSGTKGKRMILPHSHVLIHQLLAALGNGVKQATDIEIFALDVSRRKKELCALIAEATGQSEEKVYQDCERDYTLSAEEALEYGIVDRIVEKHRK